VFSNFSSLIVTVRTSWSLRTYLNTWPFLNCQRSSTASPARAAAGSSTGRHARRAKRERRSTGNLLRDVSRCRMGDGSVQYLENTRSGAQRNQVAVGRESPMFFSRLSLGNLIELCRVLRHYLQSGLSLVEAFRKQAKSGASGVRPVAGRILARLEKGDALEEALKAEKNVFPPLFVTLAVVGEKTGNLPEVIAELEKYYLFRKKLWNQFIGMIAWPVLQFNAAIFVLAGLIFMMGFVAEMTGGGKPLDPLGLGL